MKDLSIFNVETITNELMKNPSHDSNWVNNAANVIFNSQNEYTEEFLSEFDASQIAVMNDIINYSNNSGDKIAEEKLFRKDLNSSQMMLLFEIIKMRDSLPDLAIDKLIDPSIPYGKLGYIHKAFSEGLFKIVDYIDYDINQIYEIFAGMINGLDYTKYANKEISAEKMGLIRHALELNMNVGYSDEIITVK